MATKSLVSATATLGIERRGGQGREDPGIPGCQPRSRPRVPRLLPPPLAAASARETRRSGADQRGEEQGDPRPAATSLAHSLRCPQRLTPAGRRPRGALRARAIPPDAPFPPDLEVSGNRDRSGYLPDTPDVPLPPGCEDSLAGLRGRPTRLGRTGAAGGATHGTQPCPEENRQDGGGEGRGGAAEGSARRLPVSPRTAEQLCSRLRLLRSAPPRRPARPALPGPPPTELCRYHFRRERRARRRTPTLCAGERKCSEAEPAGRNGRRPWMQGFGGESRRIRDSSRAPGMASARFLHIRRTVSRSGSTPVPFSGHTSPPGGRRIEMLK